MLRSFQLGCTWKRTQCRSYAKAHHLLWQGAGSRAKKRGCNKWLPRKYLRGFSANLAECTGKPLLTS